MSILRLGIDYLSLKINALSSFKYGVIASSEGSDLLLESSRTMNRLRGDKSVLPLFDLYTSCGVSWVVN